MKYINQSSRNLIYTDDNGQRVIWAPKTVRSFNVDPAEIFGKITGIESLSRLLKEPEDEAENQKLPKTAKAEVKKSFKTVQE